MREKKMTEIQQEEWKGGGGGSGKAFMAGLNTDMRLGFSHAKDFCINLSLFFKRPNLIFCFPQVNSLNSYVQ